MGFIFDDFEFLTLLGTFDLIRKLEIMIDVEFCCVKYCVNSGLLWKTTTIMIPTTFVVMIVIH